jgi:ribulose-phosphate 3-epimerase
VLPLKLWASITSIDLGRLADIGEQLQFAGVDGIHVDVADGVFVPDLTFGGRVVRALSARLSVPIEAHLMITEPESQLKTMADEGASRVSFHLESTEYPWRVATMAKSLGLEVGVAVNPKTSTSNLQYLWDVATFINVLTTELDGVGEHLLPHMFARVVATKRALPPHVSIQVDGGMSLEQIPSFVAAGATEFVIGRALVDSPNIHQSMADLRRTLGDV